MAFDRSNFNGQNQEEEQAPSTLAGMLLPSGQPGGPGIASGGSAAASQSAPAGPVSGGGNGGDSQFVNFQRLLNANLGSAQNMANGVANNISNEGDQATKQMNTARQVFQTDASKGWSTTPTTATSTFTRPQPKPTGNVAMDQANAQKYASSPTASNTYGQVSGSYTGPKDVANDPNSSALWSAATTGAANTAGDINNTQSVSGLQALLGGKGTPGENLYDAAYTNAVGGNQFKALQNKYANLKSALDTYEGDSKNYAAQVAQNGQAQVDATNAALTPKKTPYPDDYLNSSNYSASAAAQASRAGRGKGWK